LVVLLQENQMFTSYRAALLASTIVGFTALSAPAFAQQAAPATTTAAAQPRADEIVVVTGSRIRRSAENASAPLIQITQDEVLQSGEPNVIDFLADIPALSGSTVPEDTTGPGLNDGGLSLLSLRDLGSVRTLVLVDGRRHVGAPQGSLSVDVDSIPRLLIKSTEIITGGQSAVYGADAVAGVVNFLLKRDFDGIDIDASLAQINQDGQISNRLSTLFGKNLFDNKLNVYLSAEYDANEEVRDSDVDFRRAGWTQISTDVDVNAATPDGILDVGLFRDVRNISRVRGGTLVIAGNPRPSADGLSIPLSTCTIPAGGGFLGNIPGSNAACFANDPNQNRTFIFTGPSSARAPNYGSYQAQTGLSRALNVGGDGLNIGTEFSQGSRIGESVAQRYQAGFNITPTENFTVFGEYKYVKEETYDEGQPTFFDIGIAAPVANRLPALIATSQFNIGLDNPYLPADVRTAINSNVRPVYNAAGVQTGTVADARALLRIFGPVRDQNNVREVNRLVVGARGGADEFGFVKDISWEVGYTRGEVANRNRELGVDVTRFYHSADVVVDTAGVLGTAGANVCRVKLLVAQGVAVADPIFGGNYTAANPTVANCVPQNLFGVDMRVDGYNPAAETYYDAAITVNHTNVQTNFLAFASGNLWDFWGAGPIGVAGGVETREERTGGVGRSAGTAGRLLFLNTGPDFAPAKYDVREVFGEVRIPLIKDWKFAEYVEISGAARQSDYSTVGVTNTWSTQAQYRVNRSLLFRATLGNAVRVPNLAESFAPATQTFANGFVDPCDRAQVNATPQPFQANRIANCSALLGSNWSSNPTTGSQIVYTSGIPGRNAGNALLAPEESESFTWSIVLTPESIKNFSVVVDYYDIEITNVISAVTLQQASFACVNDAAINTSACSTFTRNGFIAPGDPANFRIIDFVQGSINYAKLRTRGADFAVKYRTEFESLIGRDWGALNFGLRGNYLIRNESFFNPSLPQQSVPFDTTLGLPRVRFLASVGYEPTDKLRFSLDWDWQASQEIVDDTIVRADTDARPRQFNKTGDYSQFDLTVRYEVNDRLALRAGVVNFTDADPVRWLGSTTSSDNFDLFGRRFFLGVRYTR
jgi:outer membrane receptor protein involved in Fe transport